MVWFSQQEQLFSMMNEKVQRDFDDEAKECVMLDEDEEFVDDYEVCIITLIRYFTDAGKNEKSLSRCELSVPSSPITSCLSHNFQRSCGFDFQIILVMNRFEGI